MSVAFLSSALLVGLVVAAAPVIVHLISRRRARVVKFAAMEFVMRSQRRASRTIKLRQLILLVVRTLLLVALALALARPVLRPDDVGPTKTTDAPLAVVFVIDTSGSMSARLDGRTMAARARDKARERILALPEDVQIAVLACDDAPRDLLVPPSFDRARALSSLDLAAETAVRGVVTPCVERAVAVSALVAGEGERRVVVVSDLAAHAFVGDASEASAPGVVIEWVPALDEPPPFNVGVTTLDVSRSQRAAGATLEVRFGAHQSGGVARAIPVDFFVDGARAARAELTLAADARADRTFTHTFAGASENEGDDDARDDGTHEVRIVLPDDALALDDAVDVPVDVPPPLSVLLVDGAPEPVPLDDEVYYLESALRRDHALGGRLAVEVVGPDALTPATVARARVLVLANVGPLDAAVATSIVELVRSGGGLFVTVGDQVDVDWMNSALGDVLPGRLRGSKGLALLDDVEVADVLGLARFRAAHPALAPLAGDGATLSGLSKVATRTFMLLEPDDKAPRDVVVAYTNDAPALVERRVDAGRVMLLTTTIDRDWTDLPIRPGFLPLVQQIVLHLAGALDDAGPRVVVVGDTRQVALPRDVDEVWITPPGGRATLVEPVVQDGRAVALYDEVRAPGLYRVAFARKGGEPSEAPRERFTALFPESEGELARVDEESLARATPSGARRARAAFGEEDTPLWPLLLVVMALFFFVESALVRRAAR